MASPIVMPSFGMYTAEGTLVSWLQPAGAAVSEGDPVLEIETDKATQEVVAPASGFLHQLAQVGARLQEQMIIGYVLAEGEKPPSQTNSTEPQATSATEAKTQHRSTRFVKATPMARRLAQQHGVVLEEITPTGPGGRIIEKDVLAVAEQKGAGAATTAGPASYPWRIRERVPLSGMRRTIAERLKHSQIHAVSLTLTREVIVKSVMEARAELKDRSNEPIPVDAFFIKAFALAHRDQPQLNATIGGNELLFLDEINVGFAVALPNGLSVPVIRESDRISVSEIAKRMGQLVAAAREGRLKGADIEGGTTTISNLGGHGIDGFTPVLNPPQSTILGIGRILDRPVVVSGKVEIQPTVWLSLTFDHRVADGAVAAQLLEATVKHLQNKKSLTAA